MPPTSSLDRVEQSNYAAGSGSRAEAMKSGEQRFEKSGQQEKQSEHSRGETVASGVGDYSPNNAIKAMQGKNESLNSEVASMLAGASISGLDGRSHGADSGAHYEAGGGTGGGGSDRVGGIAGDRGAGRGAGESGGGGADGGDGRRGNDETRGVASFQETIDPKFPPGTTTTTTVRLGSGESSNSVKATFAPPSSTSAEGDALSAGGEAGGGHVAGAGAEHAAIGSNSNDRGAGSGADSPGNHDGSDRGSPQAGGDSGGDKSISMPTRNDILTKSLSELKELLAKNDRELEDVVGQNMTTIRENRLALHGTNQEGMDGLNRDHAAKGSSKENFCVATPVSPPTDARDWMNKIGGTIDLATSYSDKDKGGIAVIRLPEEDTKANGDYSDLTCIKVGKPRTAGYTPLPVFSSFEALDLAPKSNAASNKSDLQDYSPNRNPYIQPVETAEIKMRLDTKTFDESMAGWIKPSSWSGLSSKDSKNQSQTSEQVDRNNVAEAFERQGAITELLNTIDINLPKQKWQTPEQQKPDHEQTQAPQKSESDPDDSESIGQRLLRWFAA